MGGQLGRHRLQQQRRELAARPRAAAPPSRGRPPSRRRPTANARSWRRRDTAGTPGPACRDRSCANAPASHLEAAARRDDEEVERVGRGEVLDGQRPGGQPVGELRQRLGIHRLLIDELRLVLAGSARRKACACVRYSAFVWARSVVRFSARCVLGLGSRWPPAPRAAPPRARASAAPWPGPARRPAAPRCRATPDGSRRGHRRRRGPSGPRAPPRRRDRSPCSHRARAAPGARASARRMPAAGCRPPGTGCAACRPRTDRPGSPAWPRTRGRAPPTPGVSRAARTFARVRR